MPGVKGRTNNPHGRPPKSRALTDLLLRAVARPVLVGGKRIAGKRVIAQLIAEVLTTGQLRFPPDTEYQKIAVRDWMEFVKWFYGYAEPPVQRNELTGADGGAIEVIRVKATRDTAGVLCDDGDD